MECRIDGRDGSTWAVAELIVEREGVGLRGTEAGEGMPVVLLHGLTATRRYLVMGSRALERSGHRVVAYDARGHGESDPAGEEGAYDYVNLAADLEAVMDALDVERAVLAGASMGAHTILRFALERPERVGAVALVTPAHDPAAADDPARLERWDALAEGLRREGVEGFMAAYGEPRVGEAWRTTVLEVMRQRLGRHRHPGALADALQAVPRSHPFESFEQLAAIDVPAVVVASRDEVDPEHPFAVAEAMAGAMPRSQLVSEAPGASPLAWQGAQLSRVIAEMASRAAREGLLG